MRKLILAFTVLFSLANNNQLIAQDQLWGVTSQGGIVNNGVIFKTNPDGTNYSVKYEFQGPPLGYSPQGKIIELPNGKLYGTTSKGGAFDIGTIFEFDPSSMTFSKRFEFSKDINSPTAVNGNSPTSLILMQNGKLYGLASGGINNTGVLFEYDPILNVYTKKVDFVFDSNGYYPSGLTLASNGQLHVSTTYGGITGYGALLAYNPSSNALTKVFDFSSSTGKNDRELTQILNGKLYGTTSSGGLNNNGTLFEVDLNTNTYTKKVDFLTSSTGSGSGSALILAPNGKLYGTNATGGANNFGVLFEYDPSANIFTKKFDFISSTGANPVGLNILANGNISGLTTYGGAFDNGVIFEYNFTTNQYVKHFDFNITLNAGIPTGYLTQASNGKLYSACAYGGLANAGAFFQFDLSNSVYLKIIDFIPADGKNPEGGLTEALNGKLYGITRSRESPRYGNLFEFDPITSAIKTIKRDLINITEGGLTLASNGKLYGMDRNGNTGELFEFNPTDGQFSIKYSFQTSTSNGYYPEGRVIQANNGKLYGITHNGGTADRGVLFEFDLATNTYAKKIDFNGTTMGAFPSTSLVQASNGKLYGATSNGGTNSYGVLFEYDIASNSFSVKYNFLTSTNGGVYITEMSNKLYGLSGSTFFIYDVVTNTYSSKALDSNTGYYSYGNLFYSNSKFYGLTVLGGANGFGTLFEYDPVSDAFTKKIDFTGTNGASAYGSLAGWSKLGQSITFNSLPSKTYNWDGPFTLSATASSALAVSYSSSNTSVATVSGNTVTITGAGVTTITANQAGNTYYNAATSMGQSFTVNKAAQGIIFNLDFHPHKKYGDAPFDAGATVYTGLPITYTSSNPAIATVSGSTITITGAGSVTITANQPGDANYLAAPPANQTLIIDKADQFITFNSLPTEVTCGSKIIRPAAASSGLPITYSSSNTSKVIVSGDTLKVISGTGGSSVTIIAKQSGNANFNAAATITKGVHTGLGTQIISFNTLPAQVCVNTTLPLVATASSGLSGNI